MPPKHGLSQSAAAGSPAKRKRGLAKSASRSATPAGYDPVSEVPFVVRYPVLAANRLGKMSKESYQENEELKKNSERVQSPFVAPDAKGPGELDTNITVTPAEEWEAMKKYNNFVIQKEIFRNNQCVFVRTPKTPDTANGTIHDERDFWVARILQVRAKDAQHVYALVAWLWWPDELPVPSGKSADLVKSKSGRRKYHGNYELVASNDMQVLDVLSFAGKADVAYWSEEDDQITAKLYWRQTFRRETQELSKLKEHCVCSGYYNPDKPMYICDNPSSCGIWLHKDCIIDAALTKVYQEVVDGTIKAEVKDESANGTATNGRKSAAGTAKKQPYIGKLSGKILDAVNGQEGPLMIEVTDLRNGHAKNTWQESVRCPKCDYQLQL